LITFGALGVAIDHASRRGWDEGADFARRRSAKWWLSTWAIRATTQ
jgi:hypothetical protein